MEPQPAHLWGALSLWPVLCFCILLATGVVGSLSYELGGVFLGEREGEGGIRCNVTE